jgi:hypothetical protein
MQAVASCDSVKKVLYVSTYSVLRPAMQVLASAIAQEPASYNEQNGTHIQSDMLQVSSVCLNQLVTVLLY